LEEGRQNKSNSFSDPSSYVYSSTSNETDAGVLAFAFVDHLDIVEVDSPRLYQQSVLELTAPIEGPVTVIISIPIKKQVVCIAKV